jgi:hypothetical protein
LIIIIIRIVIIVVHQEHFLHHHHNLVIQLHIEQSILLHLRLISNPSLLLSNFDHFRKMIVLLLQQQNPIDHQLNQFQIVNQRIQIHLLILIPIIVFMVQIHLAIMIPIVTKHEYVFFTSN